MREDDDLFELEDQPSRVDYKEYGKKVAKNPNEGVIMFISAFFVMLLLFLGIAKQISPDVDVAIGDDENQTSEESLDVEDYTKSSVDERLKLIQMEDAGAVAHDEEGLFDDSLEERVKLPDKVKKHEQDIDGGTIPNDPLPSGQEQKEAVTQNVVEHPISKVEPVVAPPQASTSTPAPTPVNAKVVVGYYATAEQAQVAKGILMEAGLNISPFVKQIGGAYTIQVGSFSSREKAQSAANDLLRNNFPARVIVE